MQSNFKSILVVLAAGLVGAGLSCLLLRSPSSAGAKRVKADKAVSVVKTSQKEDVRKVTEISLVKNNGKTSVRIVESEMLRPGLAPKVTEEDVDEENLSPEEKQILADLQEALDDNNLKKVRKVLSRLMARIEKGERVPVCMRSKAVEALGWFGKDAAIDLMVFVADSNEEVSSDAFNQFESALQDCEMGDRERSTIVKAAMKAFNDAEQIDSLLTQLNDMRNSVKVATISDILANGTDQAKKMMQEQLSDYTDSEVTNESDMKKWLAENPDDEGDAELYGGSSAK